MIDVEKLFSGHTLSIARAITKIENGTADSAALNYVGSALTGLKSLLLYGNRDDLGDPDLLGIKGKFLRVDLAPVVA